MNAGPRKAPHHVKAILGVMLAAGVLFAAFFPLRPAPRPEDADVVRVEFSADGKEILGGTRSGLVYLWAVPDGKLLGTGCLHKSWLDRTPAPFNSLALAPSGRYLAMAGNTLAVIAARGEHRPDLETPNAAFGGVAISPDGVVLSAVSSQERLLLWDLRMVSQPKDMGAADAGVYGATAFSGDGKRLAAAGHTLRMVDVSTGRELWHSARDSYAFLSVAFRPDGGLIATGSQDASIRIWEAGTGREVQRLRGHGSYVDAVNFSPLGDELVSWARDGGLFLWELTPGGPRRTVLGTTKGDAVFSPDGRWIASGGPSAGILFWDASGKTPAKTFYGEVPKWPHRGTGCEAN